jgi:RecA-family ATPase
MAIDIMAAFEQQPPALDFVLPGFLAGTVGALVAPGATGKSFFALEMAMAVAGHGSPRADLVGVYPSRAGKVVYYAAEDPTPALVGRIHAIGQHLPQETRTAIAQGLVVEPVVGSRLNLMDEKHLQQVIASTTGARLVILDTISRLHTLDENSNGDMAALLSSIEYAAVQTGASFLFLHHVSKAASRDGQLDQQQAARGASALTDNARWGAYVAKMTESEADRLSDRLDRVPIGEERRRHFLRFGVSKQNYSAMPTDRWYQRKEGGVLLPVELKSAGKSDAQEDKRTGRRRDNDL